MEKRTNTKAFRASAAIALSIGFGLAIGNSMDNAIMGLIIAAPLGIALYQANVAGHNPEKQGQHEN